LGTNRQSPYETIHEIEMTAAPQKRISTVWVVLLCIAAAAFSFFAVYVGRRLVQKGTESLVEDKTFSLSGISITLTNEFEIFKESENTASSRDISLTVFAEPFSISDGLEDMSDEDYLTLVRDLNGHYGSEILTASNAVRYFTFTLDTDGEAEASVGLFNVVCIVRGRNCFYTCQFSSSDPDKLGTIIRYAATAKEE